MSILTVLTRLQSIDLELDEKIRRARAIEEALASDPVVSSARAESEKEYGKLKSLRIELGDEEFEGQRLDSKTKELESRLYSGRVQNPKELDGLERELQMLKRQRSELDDQILQKLEEIDNSQSRAVLNDKALKDAQGIRDAQVEHLLREGDQVGARITELTEQRAQYRAELDTDSLRIYDRLRRTKSNRAVALVKRDACSTCGVSVPTGMIQRVRTGDELVFCSGCGRILSI